MREGGLEAAKEVRRGYAELLQGLIEKQSSGQIASIWRAMEHVLRRWKHEGIPIKAMKIPSLVTLVSESETEMEDRIAKRVLQALLEAKQRRKVSPRKGQSLPRAASPAPAIGAVKPDPPSPGTNHPQPKIKEDIVSPRTELRQEIAKQTAALEEEKRLRVQLGRVVAERESLRRDRPRNASPRGLNVARDPLRHRSVKRTGRIALEEEGDRGTSGGVLAGSRSASLLDRSSLAVPSTLC
jgi:hypothetical protein